MLTCKNCKHWQEYYPRSKERVCNRPGLHIGSDWNLSSGDATVVDCDDGFVMLTGPDFGCTLAEPYHICKFCGCKAPDDQTFCSKECERNYYEVSKTYWEESASWPPE